MFDLALPLSEGTFMCLTFYPQSNTTGKVNTFDLAWGEAEILFQKELSWVHPNFHAKKKEVSAFLETQA